MKEGILGVHASEPSPTRGDATPSSRAGATSGALILPVAVIVLLLFGPKRGVDVQSAVSSVVLLFATVYVALGRRPLREFLPPPLDLVGCSLVLLLLWSAGVAVVNGMIDLFYPLRSARALLTFLACAVVTRWWCHAGGSADGLLKVLFWALCVQAAVVIAEIVSVDVRAAVYTYWSGYVPGGPDWLRVAGLIVGLAFTSIIQLIGLAIGILCIEKARGLERILLGAGISLTGISLLFTGRTGLLLGFLLIPVLLLRRKGRGLLMGAALFLLMGLVGSAVFMNLDEQNAEVIWNWAFEWLPGEGRSGAVPSVDLLRDMWFLPKDQFGLLVGSSRSYHQWDRDDPNLVSSDVGYVAILHGIGIPGLLLSSLSYLVLALYAWRWRKVAPQHSFSVLVAVLAILIGNGKEVMFQMRWGWELTVLLAGSLVLKRLEVSDSTVPPQPEDSGVR